MYNSITASLLRKDKPVNPHLAAPASGLPASGHGLHHSRGHADIRTSPIAATAVTEQDFRLHAGMQRAQLYDAGRHAEVGMMGLRGQVPYSMDISHVPTAYAQVMPPNRPLTFGYTPQSMGEMRPEFAGGSYFVPPYQLMGSLPHFGHHAFAGMSGEYAPAAAHSDPFSSALMNSMGDGAYVHGAQKVMGAHTGRDAEAKNTVGRCAEAPKPTASKESAYATAQTTVSGRKRRMRPKTVVIDMSSVTGAAQAESSRCAAPYAAKDLTPQTAHTAPETTIQQSKMGHSENSSGFSRGAMLASAAVQHNTTAVVPPPQQPLDITPSTYAKPTEQQKAVEEELGNDIRYRRPVVPPHVARKLALEACMRSRLSREAATHGSILITDALSQLDSSSSDAESLASDDSDRGVNDEVLGDYENGIDEEADAVEALGMLHPIRQLSSSTTITATTQPPHIDYTCGSTVTSAVDMMSPQMNELTQAPAFEVTPRTATTPLDAKTAYSKLSHGTTSTGASTKTATSSGLSLPVFSAPVGIVGYNLPVDLPKV